MASRYGKTMFGKAGRLAGLKSVAVAVQAATTGEGPALTDRLSSLPRLARAVSRGEYHGVSGTQLAAMSAAAAYVISPIDLIPEAVLGVVGLADDALVLTWFATTLVRVTDDFLLWEKNRNTTVEGERVR